MTSPTAFDDTSTDHERFEAEQLAQDRDAGQSTADLTDAAARHFVNDLVDGGVATPIAERRVLVHGPSGTAFDSVTRLAVFHRGWTASRDEEASARQRTISGCRFCETPPSAQLGEVRTWATTTS